MTDAITLPSQPDFSGLSLIRSSTGHVRTPFFTFTSTGDQHKDEMLFIRLRAASQRAFSSALDISENDMIFSQRNDMNGEVFWCWGSKSPQPLPKKKALRKADSLAIDI